MGHVDDPGRSVDDGEAEGGDQPDAGDADAKDQRVEERAQVERAKKRSQSHFSSTTTASPTAGKLPRAFYRRLAITAPCTGPGAVIADLGLRQRRTRSPQMTLLRVLPSGASRPFAVHFPRSG